jgi:hypothetical protein
MSLMSSHGSVLYRIKHAYCWAGTGQDATGGPPFDPVHVHRGLLSPISALAKLCLCGYWA